MLGLAVIVAPAMAHHSFAGFDMDKTLTLSGTLVRIDFSAPHARVIMMHLNDSGVTEEYQFMTGSPTQLLQRGLDPRTVHKGDKVEITYHPTRNGSLGGHMVKLVFSDGRVFDDPLAGAGAQPPQSQSATQ
jgi:hypothetical protein